MDPLVLGLVSTVVGLWLGSVEYRLRSMDSQLRNTPDRKELRESVEAINSALRDIEMNANTIEAALRQLPSRAEVREDIEARQEGIRLLLAEIKEDIKDLRRSN